MVDVSLPTCLRGVAQRIDETIEIIKIMFFYNNWKKCHLTMANSSLIESSEMPWFLILATPCVFSVSKNNLQNSSLCSAGPERREISRLSVVIMKLSVRLNH